MHKMKIWIFDSLSCTGDWRDTFLLNQELIWKLNLVTMIIGFCSFLSKNLKKYQIKNYYPQIFNFKLCYITTFKIAVDDNMFTQHVRKILQTNFIFLKSIC